MGRDDEQVWAELVQSYHWSYDDNAAWPGAEDIDPDVDPDAEPDDDDTDANPAVSTTRPAFAGSPWITHASGERQERFDEDHFVPPPPPPLPRTDLITWMAWAGLLGTPVLFIGLVLLGRSLSGLAGLAAATAFVGGFAVLIMRLRGHDPYDPDSGAVV
jgi:hypothetical protein